MFITNKKLELYFFQTCVVTFDPQTTTSKNMIFVNSERKSRKNTGSKKDPHPTFWMMIFDGEVGGSFQTHGTVQFHFDLVP